jgi:hypothetical protein
MAVGSVQIEPVASSKPYLRIGSTISTSVNLGAAS